MSTDSMTEFQILYYFSSMISVEVELCLIKNQYSVEWNGMFLFLQKHYIKRKFYWKKEDIDKSFLCKVNKFTRK